MARENPRWGYRRVQASCSAWATGWGREDPTDPGRRPTGSRAAAGVICLAAVPDQTGIRYPGVRTRNARSAAMSEFGTAQPAHRALPGQVVTLRLFFRLAARPRSRMMAATVFWLTRRPAARRSAVTRRCPGPGAPRTAPGPRPPALACVPPAAGAGRCSTCKTRTGTPPAPGRPPHAGPGAGSLWAAISAATATANRGGVPVTALTAAQVVVPVRRRPRAKWAPFAVFRALADTDGNWRDSTLWCRSVSWPKHGLGLELHHSHPAGPARPRAVGIPSGLNALGHPS
jgi:hypothetical protein